MMFRTISHRIALQFTAFVFGLLLLNGMVFLAVDLSNAQRQARFRLQESVRLMQRPDMMEQGAIPRIPPMLREYIRLLDADGRPIHTGEFFVDVPVLLREGFEDVTVEGQPHRVMTQPLRQGRRIVGYVQVADLERMRLGELPERVALYLLVSVFVSVGTFWVGLFFARRSLRPAEQMVERLEQFTQDASHELRTPLTAARTSLDLALLGQDPSMHVAAAQKELQHLSVLTERLLEMAQLDRIALHPQATDVSTLLAEQVSIHTPVAEQKGVKLVAHIAPHVVWSCDAALLRLAVANLIGNAIKFTDADGRVDVTLSADALRVDDTGRGISPEALPHIFDRFYQEEQSRSDTDRGYGLGLALVRTIVDVHGWDIRVESTPAKGTQCTIRPRSSTR